MARKRAARRFAATAPRPSSGGDVDPDEAGRQGQRLAIGEGEYEGAVAVDGLPGSGVALALVVHADRAVRVDVEIVDVRAVAVADVQELLLRVQDDHHLDPQRLLEARVRVRVALLRLAIGARRRIVGVRRVVLGDGKRRPGAAGGSRHVRPCLRIPVGVRHDQLRNRKSD